MDVLVVGAGVIGTGPTERVVTVEGTEVHRCPVNEDASPTRHDA